MLSAVTGRLQVTVKGGALTMKSRVERHRSVKRQEVGSMWASTGKELEEQAEELLV